MTDKKIKYASSANEVDLNSNIILLSADRKGEISLFYLIRFTEELEH